MHKHYGRTDFMEPIILSGKPMGIKLLSSYDFMIYSKMHSNLLAYLRIRKFEKVLCENISEQACLVSMCLYTSQNQRIFSDGLAVLKMLTPEELKFVYTEYIKLYKKILAQDKITYTIVEGVKKHRYQKLLKNNLNHAQ